MNGISKGLYWIDVLHSVDEMMIVIILLAVVGVVIGFIIAEECDYPNWVSNTTIIVSALVFLGSIGIKCAIPSKETMRNIMIVETVSAEETIEGAKQVYEWVKEEIKTWNE